jgi:Domain of unknown function (DUF4865)
VLAMQYESTLPADYDMGVIRHRVATRGAGTDAWPGLALKAYLVRERGVGGSTVNAYAPFYLWNTTEGMNDFLWGTGFRGVLSDFGRPVVRQWTGLGFEPGPAFGAPPVTAARRVWLSPADADPAADIAAALARIRTGAHSAGVHSVALAIDTSRWQLVELTLLGTALPELPEDSRVQYYQVLHLSAPGTTDLRAGQHWP